MSHVFDVVLKCVAHPHRTCIYARGELGGHDELDGGGPDAAYAPRRVRPISRAPDGRFVLTGSRSSSVSSSTDDGGFLTHPAFRDLLRVAPARAPTTASPSLQHDLVGSQRSELSLDSRQHRAVAAGQTPLAVPISVIYSTHTPFLSSSPASTTVWSPLLSPNYFSDLSSVRPAGSAERASARSQPHDSYGQELPSLEAIREENERILNSYSPSKVIKPRFTRLPSRHVRYARSAPELVPALPHPSAAPLTPLEVSPDSRSSSSGLGSKNTSQQTASPGDWKLPPYRAPPPPPPTTTALVAPPPAIPAGPVLSAKPPYLRTWLDYTPSPTHSNASNKPLSVDDHYEFDPIFPASPTPTELVLTPLPPMARKPQPPSTSLKQDEIEARVQAMKEEFHEYKRRQAQMKRLKDMESMC